MRLTWHPNMSPEEEQTLLRQCAALDEAYARAAALEPPAPTTEDEQLEAEALEEQGLEYFNHYIAGDR